MSKSPISVEGQSFWETATAPDDIVNRNTGNVGIGTDAPSAKLDVVGGIVVENGSETDPSFSFGSDTNTGFYSKSSDVIGFASGGVDIGDLRNTNTGGYLRLSNPSLRTDFPATQYKAGIALLGPVGVFELYADGSNVPMKVGRPAFGQLIRFLGVSTGAGGIQTTGSASLPAFYSGSDVRLKENISTLPSVWDDFKALRPVEYTVKADGSQAIGFIAQEVEPIWPDVVGLMEEEDPDSVKTLSGLGKIEARIVRLLQELIERVEALEGV